MEIERSHMEVQEEVLAGKALAGKAQSRLQQQLSRQELQNYNARRMRSLSFCWTPLQRVWVARRAPCRK